MSSNEYRTERDPLGKVKIPKRAYYGSQTQRAIENFQISNKHLPRSFIKAQGIIKVAAAKVNIDLGMLTKNLGEAIITASEEVINGEWDDQFVVDVYQAGAGTSQNMNANEVIANRANEILNKGTHAERIHPNDHVNMSQSTNDTFPTALNIAALEGIHESLIPAIDQLQQALNRKSEELMSVLKSGRTHLHDAVPMKLGQEFAGYAETIRSLYEEIKQNSEELYEIGLGGNAIGTKVNLHESYAKKVIAEVSKRTNYPFREPTNIFSFMQNRNAPLRVMGSLKELSVHLIKITSDLRLLSSGPRTGLAEITLPSVQPGSTIMPGKVNPAILEMTHMVCCQVIGYESTLSTAVMSGQLEINVMMPIIAYTLLESIHILANAITSLVEKCITGIKANEATCRKWMEESLSLVTGLSPSMGYDLASEIGQQAEEENKTIKQILIDKGLNTKENISAIDPSNFI
ncbi:class II fumarate hydratase [Evansella cellulosilytica]|uniref:Fumarate lyase n=1 Tax=Evansella cellulosilytica (strain ATCC 21833 / DSM 2522 / FERM P-1141 / JCM 9156 / N-4) TaxID=649639 RepID=E6TQN6_EVAC2|nr:aspartate ammonia-lyase [Evansella cellulosilytica]ADU30547.1 fumarate lyase [Evansella cellulosilytica DSM 2522]